MRHLLVARYELVRGLVVNVMRRVVRGFGAVGGFTLVELVLVVLVLALLASIAIVRIETFRERSTTRLVELELKTIREALVGSDTAPAYLPDMERIPGFTPTAIRLHNLLNPTNVFVRTRGGLRRLDEYEIEMPPRGCAPFNTFTNWNEESERGWRGPYLRVNRGVSYLPEHPAADGAAPQGLFPAPTDRRYQGDATFEERGFFPKQYERQDMPDEDGGEEDGEPEDPEGLVVHLAERTTAYGVAGELALADPWGNPYILQIPPGRVFERPTSKRRMYFARLVSAGPNGIVETPCFPIKEEQNAEEKCFCRLGGRLESGAVAARGDDIVLFLTRADIYEEDE